MAHQDQKAREDAFKAARAAAQQLLLKLGNIRMAFDGTKDGKASEIYVPKAKALVHEIEALIKKAEKDLK